MTPDDLTNRVRGIVPWEGRIVEVVMGDSPDGPVTFIDGVMQTPDEARRFAETEAA